MILKVSKYIFDIPFKNRLKTVYNLFISEPKIEVEKIIIVILTFYYFNLNYSWLVFLTLK